MEAYVMAAVARERPHTQERAGTRTRFERELLCWSPKGSSKNMEFTLMRLIHGNL